MSNPLTDLLAEKGTLLADGATGTNLFNMGLMSGDAPEMWNTEQPQNIIKLYQGAVQSGSDIFLTNSFGANASRLKLHNAEKRAHELSRVSAELAREVADKAGRKVIVAGSVGPTGEIMEPVGPLTHALSFDTAGRTMMGMTSEAMVDMVHDLDYGPLAYGANCGTGASDVLRTVLGFASKGMPTPIVSKGNAGIPKYVEGHIHYDGTPELMADYAEMARNCGASIIGGCCGTMPEHLVHMRAALDSRPKGDAPTLEQIVEALGPFSSASDGTDGEGPTRAPRRGRRRG